MAAPEPSDSSDDATQPRRPRVDDTTGYGVAMTFVAGVLLALAYYGWLAIRGPYGLGQALPEPFYLLAIALLFVVELLNSRRAGLVVAIARAMAVAALYGALFVLAVEGGAYIMDDPAVFLENFVGVTVVAISLVAAALVYVTYLTVVEAS
ncbi:hypothetical protein [Natronosalvus rutilus]|uniref:Uncharacterized protein n=1 Tax=Natronosalvus rutilus TaxID=2953753 RepID=A0A9E7N5I3_9EURY|nr:hypothetical protein [Natronosalvus rutilus]UTF52112.1 hypothetical protein NGM29_09880 [Natronosalvus rutilus]